jgi:ketosteroid isomerase-like protein
MSQSSLQAVQFVLEAVVQRDVPKLLAGFTPDIVWWNNHPPYMDSAGEFRGPEAVLRMFNAMVGTFDILESKVHQRIVQDDSVVLVAWERLKARQSGKVFENPWTSVVTVRDGKVASVRLWCDSYAMALASPPA